MKIEKYGIKMSKSETKVLETVSGEYLIMVGKETIERSKSKDQSLEGFTDEDAQLYVLGVATRIAKERGEQLTRIKCGVIGAGVLGIAYAVVKVVKAVSEGE